MSETMDTPAPPIGAAPRLKIDLMFEGIRYSDALARAAEHAYPNYYPYRFKPGEHDPTGQGKAEIPYLLTMPDGTSIRIKGNGDSPWSIAGDRAGGYRLRHDGRGDDISVRFEPLPAWMRRQTGDGFPLARAGVSLHGDMAIVNVAPGCEYFLHKHDGAAMRCVFCSYGAPDERTAHLGQKAGQVPVPALTLGRMQEALRATLAEMDIRHVYLVGGSLPDGEQEGERFLGLARAVQEVVAHRIPVSLGSGALSDEMIERFHAEGLVDNVCFNLEVWSEPLFAKICPGKHRYVGYARWIAALEHAVSLWGRGRVYSAMVAGIELEPEHGLDWESAAALAIRGADDLCGRGIIPIYSIYWPLGGRDHPQYYERLRAYFERLNAASYVLRRQHGLAIWDGFMCHRCAYMQLECDVDRALAGMPA
jgi:hypothetical protein